MATTGIEHNGMPMAKNDRAGMPMTVTMVWLAWQQ